MKGCLNDLFKALTVFAVYIVFGTIIGALMMEEPPLAIKKNSKKITKQERLEIIQYQDNFRAAAANGAFFSAPLTAFSAYMIFRKKSKT